MSTVTYSDLRLKCPPQPQRRQELKTPKRKGPSEHTHKDLAAPSSSWKITAVILGIICLALFLSVGFLTTKLTQYSCNAEQQCNEGANKTVLKYPTCSTNWYQHGENCYFFPKIMYPWKQCQGYCSGLNSSFVKVETEEDMNFLLHLSKLQCGMSQKMFFISLYYDSERMKWVWLDGTPFTLDKIKIPRYKNFLNKCMHIKYGELDAEDCQLSSYCICRKTTYLKLINI